MRIAIVGTGAMGSLFASHLADTGAEIWAFDVWREHVDGDAARRADRASGWQARAACGIHATSDPADAGICDISHGFREVRPDGRCDSGRATDDRPRDNNRDAAERHRQCRDHSRRLSAKSRSHSG